MEFTLTGATLIDGNGGAPLTDAAVHVQGERIAWVGDGASSGRSRLYFEVRKNGKPVDPVPWFRRSQARRR